MNPVDALISVLCDQVGKCSIQGSDADRQIVDTALAALRAQRVPMTDVKLLAVADAAERYYRLYAQDEASEDGCYVTGCTLSQNEDAIALRDALKALEAP